MTKDFRSDNTLGCSPEILDAMKRAAHGTATSYGDDEITARVRGRCREIFERDVDVFPVITGSAANALSVASMTEPWGAVFCHVDAHIQRDELGGVEFFSGGAKLITIPGADGKLHPVDVQNAIDDVRNGNKTAVPSVLSLTNATEAGTVYTNDEVRSLIEVARRNQLRVHLDGARLANAIVSAAANVDGVDILSFGVTKNGGLTADLIVVFNKQLAEGVSIRWHRSGHRPSKSRFLSAQIEAYLANDLWMSNARHANAMAARLRDAISGKVEIVHPVEANMVFVRLAKHVHESLARDGFLFFDCPIYGADIYRIMTGFSTTREDVDQLAAAFSRL
ncbi:MAG: threonine aldolase family protein, partial [Thermoanaerobaculia bacterium]